MDRGLLEAHRKDIQQCVRLAEEANGSYLWLHGELSSKDAEKLAESIACLVSDYCFVTQELKDCWHNKRNNIACTDSGHPKLMEAYLAPIFGTSATPKSATHRQGAVAEFLWYFLFDEQDENSSNRILLEGPSFTPTSPGGDGLGVYKSKDATYLFKLWEVKKHTARSSPKTKVNSAINQLDKRAMTYLAQYSQVLTKTEKDKELANFYANLPKFWLNKDRSAGAGISVTSSVSFPKDSFENLLEQYKDLASDNGLTGLSIYIEQFPSVVEQVSKKIWAGMS